MAATSCKIRLKQEFKLSLDFGLGIFNPAYGTKYVYACRMSYRIGRRMKEDGEGEELETLIVL